MQGILEKHPNAAVLYSDFDFTDELPSDSALNTSTSTVTAVDADGTSAPSVVGTVSISSMSLRAIMQAGTNGQDYIVTFKAVGNTTGQAAVKQLELRVRTKLTGSV